MENDIDDDDGMKEFTYILAVVWGLVGLLLGLMLLFIWFVGGL